MNPKVVLANPNLRVKEVMPGFVQDNRFLTALSVQYANEEFIGEDIMPMVPTNALSGEYPVYTKRSRFAAPDDSVSGDAPPNEISDTRDAPATYLLQPYGLRNKLSVLTLRNQKAPLDEMIDLTEAVADLVALKREKRIAGVVTNASNYATSNKATLTAPWDTPSSTPIVDIMAADAALFAGRGRSKKKAAMSLEVWNALRRHPKILDLFKYGGSRPGLAKPDQICEYFDIDELLVGRSREDTANIGQSASYSRIWGKFFWLGRVAEKPSIRNAFFGSTFRLDGTVKTRVWFDQLIGTDGGYWAVVSAAEQHSVVAADTGYLISSAIT